MTVCSVVRSSRPAGLFSFGLLDGLHVRLRRPYLREAPAGVGLRHGLRSGAKEARPDASPKKPDAYSLEYVEDYFGPRTTQMIVDRLPQ